MRYIILVILFYSCSFIDEDISYCDPKLKYALDNFKSIAKSNGVTPYYETLILTVGRIETSGLCHINRHYSKITINQSFFDSGMPDSVALQYIVFHELGHFIGRGHTDGYSIMNPNKYAAEYKNCVECRDALNNELFIKFE